MRVRTLLVDNYDSYTYNIFQYLAELNNDVPIVVLNDKVAFDDLDVSDYDNVVISPGPGNPNTQGDFGVCAEIVKHWRGILPIFGVCLGHQGIALFEGAEIIHAPCGPYHGRLSGVQHDGDGVFRDLPQNFQAVRYHSLVVDSVDTCPELRVSAKTDDGIIMGVRHTRFPTHGVQFHPESICTEFGKTILKNFRDLTVEWWASAPTPRNLSLKLSPRKSSHKDDEASLPHPQPTIRQGTRVRVFRLGRFQRGAVDPAVLFSELFEDDVSPFWLDSCSPENISTQSPKESNIRRFSYMGGGGGKLYHTISYDINSRVLTTSTSKPYDTPLSQHPEPVEYKVDTRVLPPDMTGFDVLESSLRLLRGVSCSNVASGPGGVQSETNQEVRHYVGDKGGGMASESEMHSHCDQSKRGGMSQDENTGGDDCVTWRDVRCDCPFDFHGGYVGYLGYEMKKESCGLGSSFSSESPDLHFTFADRVIVIDHHPKSLIAKNHHQGLRSTQPGRGDDDVEDFYVLELSLVSPSGTCSGCSRGDTGVQYIEDIFKTLGIFNAGNHTKCCDKPSDVQCGSPVYATCHDSHSGSRIGCENTRVHSADTLSPWAKYVKETIERITSGSISRDLPQYERPEINKASSNDDDDDPCIELHHPRSLYIENVKACLQALYEGESYEVCLTTTVRSPLRPDPLPFYYRLRKNNAAPFSAFLWLSPGTSEVSNSLLEEKGHVSSEAPPTAQPQGSYSLQAKHVRSLRRHQKAICCSSPERFLSISRNGVVESRPIKGTRARGRTAEEDEALCADLRANEKDRAENLMIVDLTRNDLGRVCDVASVCVPELFEVYSYPTVHQLVTTVQGRLPHNRSAVECVKAMFPMGSMTGAPKHRTLQILDKLENRARGVYSGCIGYFSVTGTADFNVVIRTVVVGDSGVTLGAGGAIVALSDPEDEFEEMMLKAQRGLQTLTQTTDTRALFHPNSLR